MHILKRMLQDQIWIWGCLIYFNYFKLTCEGAEHLPKDSPYLLVANHASHLDGPAIIAAHGCHMHKVHSLAAKDYFFDHPLKGWFCRHVLNMIPVDRCSGSLQSFRECEQAIYHGKILLIFPEGGRSLTGQLQDLKLGFGMMALKLGVPIVPVYIQGSYKALPKGQLFPQQYPIQVCFGPPIDLISYRDKVGTLTRRQLYQAIVNQVKKSIEDLERQMTL
ncbi:1-acyl-sn-glycerol-3-phosphate acyltransferase [Leptolyngbyaceae cyanobacterium CCMR0081]|uniref:1-acyl-sn-glycerol-3-phosphate acyltransferase n=2 Tax=Adonisia TaxID=2950183 RepID=A0A6M0RRR4_9CYAN|nr:1-acyl-sn-glycerol-3-phosphate acyltransferase [Adonisia turfae CCMR0081]